MASSGNSRGRGSAVTWTDFRRQYDAQGREKADGYSRKDFEGMTLDERTLARTMMLERALDGDTIDLGGLRHVGDADTASTLASAGETTSRHGWRYDVLRREVLFELTGDHGCLTGLAPYLDGRDAEMQEGAAQAIGWYVLPPECRSFLEERIVDGRHEAGILSLMKAWIALERRTVCDPECFQRHLGLVRMISRSAPTRRRALLLEAAPLLEK